MKNLIIKDLYNIGEEGNKTEDEHILIISNKNFNETKQQLINKEYDYLICNNTLFDSIDNVLYSNYINFLVLFSSLLIIVNIYQILLLLLEITMEKIIE